MLALFLSPFSARACVVVYQTVHVGRSFRARVADHDRPISRVRLLLARKSNSTSHPPAVMAFLTDSNGYVDFRNLMPGTYFLTVNHDAGMPDGADIDVSPGGPPDVTVTLQWPILPPIDTQSVSGQIRTNYYYPSQTEPRLSLSLLEAVSGKVIVTIQTDEKGNFNFPQPVSPGLYFLRLNPAEMEGLMGIDVSPTAKLKQLSLDIKWTDCGLGYAQRTESPELKVHDLCGQVTDVSRSYLLRNASVTLMTTGPHPKVLDQKPTDKDGRFAFPAPSGSYRLIVAYPGFLPFARAIHLSRGTPPSGACQSPIQIQMSF